MNNDYDPIPKLDIPFNMNTTIIDYPINNSPIDRANAMKFSKTNYLLILMRIVFILLTIFKFTFLLCISGVYLLKTAQRYQFHHKTVM